MMIPKNFLRILALLFLLICGLFQKTYAQFSGSGSGTSSDPYIITNVTQLQEIENDRSAYYELGNDIDATETANWNGGAGFDPIGDSRYSYFSGSLQGNGYKIINLTINRPSESLIGLFGNDRSSDIENLHLINIDFTGRGAVGGLIGQKEYGTIKNVHISGIITATQPNVGGIVGSLYSFNRPAIQDSHAAVDIASCRDYTGGLVGSNSRGEIWDSSASGSLDCTGDYSRDFIGGLVGRNANDGLIKNSYASGDIFGKSYVGGLVGVNVGEIINSYSTGNVVGGSRVGGLVGSNAFLIEACFSTGFVEGYSNVGGLIGQNSGYVYSSYSSGKVSGQNTGVGGIVGSNSKTVNNSYWNTETSEQSGSAGGAGLTSAEMLQKSNFTGFDFTNDWQIYEGFSFPFLRGVGDHLTTVLEITGSENWRTMSSPLQSFTYGELFNGLWTQGFTDSDYEDGTTNIYTHSEFSQNWNPVSNASEMPGTGEGFLMYVYEDDKYGESGSFPKTVVHSGSQRFGSSELPVSLTKSGSGGAYVASDDGWNLVGNPYASPIDWDASGWSKSGLSSSIYVWSEQDEDYRTWNGSTGSLGSGVIAPWQGFWVKADNSGSPSLEVDEGARTSGGQFLKEQEYPVIEFTLNGEKKRSSAFIMLHPEASRELDRLDAWKLQPLNSDYLSFYSLLNDGHALDINTLPMSDTRKDPFSIDFDIDGTSLNGNYELSWQSKALPPDVIFVLTDNLTNEKIELNSRLSYSFQISGIQEKAKQGLSVNQPARRVIKQKLLQAKSSEQEREPRFTLTISSTTSVSQPELPATVGLKQNYPNPFNPSTVIRYQLPVSSDVELSVFDLTGRQVATLVDGPVQAGTHQVSFDGSSLSSGVYVYRLVAGDQQITRKLTLIK